MGSNEDYCAAQLTELYKQGLVTDPMLLYRLGKDLPYMAGNVGELILLLADDLIHGRITTWLSDNVINSGYTCIDLGVDLLKDALHQNKLSDPQAAYDLLASIPEY